MKKTYSNKEISGEDISNKSVTPSTLICKREAIMPGLGHWKEGDIITDPETIKQIGDNPNFEVHKEVE